MYSCLSSTNKASQYRVRRRKVSIYIWKTNVANGSKKIKKKKKEPVTADYEQNIYIDMNQHEGIEKQQENE